ncbi:MAG TPA: hypothetical protein VM577_02875, partial [Anaerovoracaceae bacterium]|nr:hypothetical protein [Anaerovoracaceae bacterium]
MSMLTINAIFKRHKQEYPDSLLSMHVIRKAVSEGELKSISSGSKRLINYDVFCRWLGYEYQIIDKLLDSYGGDKGLSDKEKDVLIRLLIE